MSARQGERRLSRADVMSLLGVRESTLLELEREAVITCDDEGCYTEHEVERIRLSVTLRDELGVNLAGVEVALQLLERLEAERRQFHEVLDWLRRRLR